MKSGRYGFNDISNTVDGFRNIIHAELFGDSAKKIEDALY